MGTGIIPVPNISEGKKMKDKKLAKRCINAVETILDNMLESDIAYAYGNAFIHDMRNNYKLDIAMDIFESIKYPNPLDFYGPERDDVIDMMQSILRL